MTKWRVGDDVLGDAKLYDTAAEALMDLGLELREGVWWGLDGGISEEDAIAKEDLQEVSEFKIGTTGTVRVSYETTVWAADEEQALEAAGELPDLLSASQFEQTDPPDASDFDPWVKAATA